MNVSVLVFYESVGVRSIYLQHLLFFFSLIRHKDTEYSATSKDRTHQYDSSSNDLRTHLLVLYMCMDAVHVRKKKKVQTKTYSRQRNKFFFTKENGKGWSNVRAKKLWRGMITVLKVHVT